MLRALLPVLTKALVIAVFVIGVIDATTKNGVNALLIIAGTFSIVVVVASILED